MAGLDPAHVSDLVESTLGAEWHRHMESSKTATGIKGLFLCSRIKTLASIMLAFLRNHDCNYLKINLFTLFRKRSTAGNINLSFGKTHYIDFASFKYQYSDIFIDKVYDLQCQSSRPLILDCGGNIGLSVLRFKQRFPHARIKVFEADPKICSVMKKNLESFDITDVEINNAAVWKENGEVSFASDGKDGGRIESGSDWNLTIRSVRLANIITEKVDILKMDIEGAEFDVMADLAAEGKLSLIDQIFCEVHCEFDSFQKVADLLNILADADFSICLTRPIIYSDSVFHSKPSVLSSLKRGSNLFNLYAWRVRR